MPTRVVESFVAESHTTVRPGNPTMPYDFSETYSQLQEARRNLEGRKEFEDWIIGVSYFPDGDEPQGVSIQLSRPGWFNESGKGIHFETWIMEKELATKKLRFVMHVLHQDFFPGTEKRPWAFLWPFLEDPDVMRFAQEWKGFKLGRSVPLKGERKFADTPTDVIVAEFAHFRQLGDKIDAILKIVLA